MSGFRFQPQQTNDELAREDLVSDAAHNLMHSFQDLAPAEALTRALVHERSERRVQALFWTDVFSLCVKLAG